MQKVIDLWTKLISDLISGNVLKNIRQTLQEAVRETEEFAFVWIQCEGQTDILKCVSSKASIILLPLVLKSK